MVDGDSPASSSALTADVADPRGSEAFALLGNETRLAILLALWEAYEPFAEGSWDPSEGNAVPFSELRERVGVRDSGQFNYHLGKVEGLFVEQTADGYQLLPAGNKIVRTLVAVAGFEDVSLDPTEIDVACPNCGAPSAVRYQHQRLYHVCTECEGYYELSDKHPSGVIAGWIANPTALRDRAPEAIYAAVRTGIYHHFAMRAAGICPECSGQIESTLHVCDAHEPGPNDVCPTCERKREWIARFVCTVCKHTSVAYLRALGLGHPAVIAFYWDHGVELGHDAQTTARWFIHIAETADEELVSREPPRVRLTLRHEDDEIQLTYDEALNVIDVTEPD